MPKSKKPRKKGAHGREQAARSRLLRNQFKDPAECRRLVKIVEDARAARHKGSAQLGYLFALADQDFMVERFIEAFMALERWQTTEEMDDFSLVNSMLMIGAIASRSACRSLSASRRSAARPMPQPSRSTIATWAAAFLTN